MIDRCHTHNARLLRNLPSKAREVLLPIVVAMACACNPNIEKKYEYRYVGQDSGRVISFDLRDKEVDDGHRLFGLELCETGSYRICIYGEFTLAVPSGALEVGDEWQVAGSHFSVVAIESGLDGAGKTYVIQSESEGPKLEIFYSQDNGIWGMKLVDGELFKSKTRCGLGCAEEPSY